MPTFFLNNIKEKWLNVGFQKYFRNLGWMFFAKIGTMVISFIATAYIARSLGPSNYGELGYAISFVSIFGFIASLGIDQILCRDLVRHPDKVNEYMGSALGLRFLSSGIAFVICIVSAFIWSSRDVSLFLIFIISLTFVFGSFQLLSYEFQAVVKLKSLSILSVIVVLILNILKIWVVFLGGGVIYLAAIILLEPILYAVALIYLRIKSFGTMKDWKFDRRIAILILKDSFPLIFASAFFAIYARIDQVMIKNMIGSESVGLYDSAVRISELWYFIPHLIMANFFPAIINAKKTSAELYKKRVRKLFILIVSVSIFTVIPTILLSKYMIDIIFGSEFYGASAVLRVYVWSNVGAAFGLVMQQVLIAENMTKIISISTFFGMIVNIVLNIFLIPKFGIVGAAYASLISYSVPFLSLFLFNKSRKLILNFFG